MQKHRIFEHFFKFLDQIGPKGTLIVTLQSGHGRVVGAGVGVALAEVVLDRFLHERRGEVHGSEDRA